MDRDDKKGRKVGEKCQKKKAEDRSLEKAQVNTLEVSL